MDKCYIVIGQSPATNYVMKVFASRDDAERFISSSPEIAEDKSAYIEEHELAKYFIPKEPLFTQAELEADFEMAVDMMEFGLNNRDKEDFNLLKEFKDSDYKSAKRLQK